MFHKNAIIGFSILSVLAWLPASVNAEPARSVVPGCRLAEDMPPVELVMSDDAVASVVPHLCEAPSPDQSEYPVYVVDWAQSGQVGPHLEYFDLTFSETDGVVGVSITRAGPDMIVIDQQEERGGLAILVWYDGQELYTRQFHYTGTDESGLEVRQSGAEAVATVLDRSSGQAKRIGLPRRFRLRAKVGISQ